MQRALNETKHRREKQLAYNKEHNVTPKGIKKAIRGSLDDKQEEARNDRKYINQVAEEKAKYAALTPKQLAKRLTQMENAMYKHAQNLEFEEASKLRDEMEYIRAIALK